MYDWNTLLDQQSISSVLSGGCARFAQPIREALVVFLEGLPVQHQDEILVRQAALPISASISARLALLARCCPVLHKLGQILARDPRLAPQLREHLRELETFPPTIGEDAIRGILARELGPLELRGLRLTPPAIAEASVAVVVPFERVTRSNLDSSNDTVCRHGVFKLLKPGIEERLELELGGLARVGVHLDERCHELRIPHLNYEDVFEQICDRLHSEIRLDEEQNHLAQAAAAYADEPHVQIPTLLDNCTPRVTAMERVYGRKVTEHRLTHAKDRKRLADLIMRALIGHPFFSRSDRALFHCDPHAGNLFLTDDHRLAILDWNLAGQLGEDDRIAIAQIIQAALTMNPERLAALLKGLAEPGAAESGAIVEVARLWVDRIRHGRLPGLSWLIGLLDDAVQTARLRFHADLMLLRKSLHTLEGVLTEIGGQRFRPDDELVGEFVGHFIRELPARLVAPASYRRFATHLSNLDLTSTWLSLPAASAQFWLANCSELLDAGCSRSRLPAAAQLVVGNI